MTEVALRRMTKATLEYCRCTPPAGRAGLGALEWLRISCGRDGLKHREMRVQVQNIYMPSPFDQRGRTKFVLGESLTPICRQAPI